MNSHPHPRSGFRHDRRRGSVLIVALIFALGIAISLGSFLQLANNATKLSYRTHYLGVAMNVAETGLEQAMWEINNAAGTWTGWTSPSAAGAHRNTYDLGKVEGGATAVVKVYAQEKTGAAPAWIVARAIITPPNAAAPIEKWVKVTLQKRTRGAIGGLGRDGIVSNGNQVVMGSWNSDPDNDPATPPIPYSDAVANDEMSLATTALDATLSSGNADINGSAAVGAKSTDAIQVGPNGYIGPFGTPNGTKDPDSISPNFSADLPVLAAPSGKTYTNIGTVAAALSLPRSGDTPNADGIYYYEVSEINLNGDALSIAAGSQVVINVTKSVGDAVSLSGNGGAIIVQANLVTDAGTGATTYSTGKLELYTPGDITVSGQGTIQNEVSTQVYYPATTTITNTTTATTISNVQTLYGQGKYGKGKSNETIIGWSYSQSATITSTTGSTTTTQTIAARTYQALKEAGFTAAPTAGTTTTTTSSSSTTPASTVDSGSYVGQANNLRIYGTRTDEVARTDDEDDSNDNAQKIKISGNGSLSAVVDAPNADIEAKGGGTSGFMYGSLIGKSLKFTGNDCFYYDESLALTDPGSRLGIEDWTEMVSYADRKDYKDYMDF